MKIIKIDLIVTGFLSSKKTTKNSTEIITREYISPITVRQVLIDAKIKIEFLGIIILDGRSIERDFIINDSCQIKLFPILGGG